MEGLPSVCLISTPLLLLPSTPYFFFFFENRLQNSFPFFTHSKTLDKSSSQFPPQAAASSKPKTNPSLIDRNPVGRGEPSMIFYVRNAILQVAVTFCQINLEKVLQQIFQFVGKVRREFNLSGNNLLVDLDWLICEEWRILKLKFNNNMNFQYLHRLPFHK